MTNVLILGANGQLARKTTRVFLVLRTTAGLVGFELGSAYEASTFGLEGWMASLHDEVAPFGIATPRGRRMTRGRLTATAQGLPPK